MRDIEFTGYTLHYVKEQLKSRGYTSVSFELLKAPRLNIEELSDNFRTLYIEYDTDHCSAKVYAVPLT